MKLTPFSAGCGVIVEDVQLLRFACQLGGIVLSTLFIKPLGEFPDIAELGKEPGQQMSATHV